MQSIIIHLDMNSYFASVEQQDCPAWRGKPVGVCEHLGGIIIAASVEAKKWGIKTGTPVWEAKKLYPKIILTHTRPEAYRNYNRKLVKLVSDYTDYVEVYSIDEVFMDITRVCNIVNSKTEILKPKQTTNHKLKKINKSQTSNLELSTKHLALRTNLVDPFAEAARIAKEIKRRMKTEMGDYLTCSVGIAENKLLAKIASDMQKPDGLVVIKNEEFRIKNYECPTPNPSPSVGRGERGEVVEILKDELYNRLKLVDIPGIGPRQERNLNALGIKTLLDLKNYPKSKLMARFGRIGGYHIYNLGQLEGSFKPEVEEEGEIKSMGHMYTLPAEFRKAEFFAPVLFKLCEMVGRRLRRKDLMGNVLSLHVHGGDKECYGKSRKLGDYVWDGREIFLQAMGIFESFGIKSSEFRLIGITVANLRPFVQQLSLFGERELLRRVDTRHWIK